MSEHRTTVYTDGACSGNPGPGGWAWVVPDGPFASGAEAKTTNQRMELTAALEATRALEGPLEIVSDSSYVVNCFRDRWWEGWLARGWVNSQKKPVANRDLWEPLIDAYRTRSIRFRWVKGHGGDPHNDLADRLAVEAAGTQTGRNGDSPPETVGAPDSKPRKATPPAEFPEGHRIAIFGHRPPEIGGYGETDTARKIRSRLVDILAAKRSLHPDLVVVSGLGLGSETLGAEAARIVAVPLAVVLAHPEVDRPWTGESRRHFAEIKENADRVTVVERKVPSDRRQAGASLTRRDAWIRRNVEEAIVVWDGTDGPLAGLVRSLMNEVGEENVWVVDPTEL